MTSLVAYLALLQLVLPLVLIVLNAIVLPVSPLGFWARCAGLFALLIYLRLSGVWLFPPWWTPYLLGVLHVAGSIMAWVRYQRRAASQAAAASVSSARRQRSPVGAMVRAVGEVMLGAVLLVAATLSFIPALQGRTVPSGAIMLKSPLTTGAYLVTSGGTTRAVNNHLLTLGNEKRFQAYRGQSYAVDLIGIDQWGLSATRELAPEDPKAYVIYGKRVLSPCNGTVVAALDGVPDMLVPQMDRDHMTGNHVIINCRAVSTDSSRANDAGSSDRPGLGEFTVVLAHLAPGSIAVKTGDSVDTGAVVGSVGNSGNTAAPHLHIHVQSHLASDQPLSAAPLWFGLDGRFLVRNDRYIVP
jgi:hypothetical protein